MQKSPYPNSVIANLPSMKKHAHAGLNANSRLPKDHERDPVRANAGPHRAIIRRSLKFCRINRPPNERAVGPGPRANGCAANG